MLNRACPEALLRSQPLTKRFPYNVSNRAVVHLFITNRLEQNPPIIIGRYPDGPNKIIRITQRPITAAIIHFIRQGQLFSIFVQMLRAKFFAEFSVFFVREYSLRRGRCIFWHLLYLHVTHCWRGAKVF